MFSFLDWKYIFWLNLVQKFKSASLTWNLGTRLFQIHKIRWWCSMFCFRLFCKFFSKKIIWFFHVNWLIYQLTRRDLKPVAFLCLILYCIIVPRNYLCELSSRCEVRLCYIRNSLPKVSCKKGKHLCQNLFSIKWQVSVLQLFKKETPVNFATFLTNLDILIGWFCIGECFVHSVIVKDRNLWSYLPVKNF